MVPERLAWTGGVIMSGVGIYLSYEPIASDLGKGLVITLATLVILAAILMFPWRRRADGSSVRIYSVKVGGRGNRVQNAGDNATQVIADRDARLNTRQPPRDREAGR
jgi:hypothetical protein